MMRRASAKPVQIEAKRIASVIKRNVETLAALRLAVSVAELTVEEGGRTISLSMPKGAQDALMNGVWDAAALLLDRFGEVRDVGARLPYVRGF
jgi:hypothetical protein